MGRQFDSLLSSLLLCENSGSVMPVADFPKESGSLEHRVKSHFLILGQHSVSHQFVTSGPDSNIMTKNF